MSARRIATILVTLVAVASLLIGCAPKATRLPSGCSFHPRCSRATERCRQEEPPLTQVEPGRFVACYDVLPLGDR